MIGKVHLVDSLFRAGIKIGVIFSPEHGFRKFSEAGQSIVNTVDSVTNIPILSLYGKKNKPVKTDFSYFFKAMYNIIFKHARSN